MKPHSTPGSLNAIPVRTYADLDRWLSAFRDLKINLLFLAGPPGLGKTRRVREALAGQPHLLIEGHATPMKGYIELFRHRDQTVVIDDEDTFHSHPQKVSLMKCLCSTEPVKRLAWGTTSEKLADAGVPGAFETTSKVCVVTNRVSVVNPHVAALFDRGCVLAFEPSAAEVHEQVRTWLPDAEVLAFFAEWLGVLPSPSMRLYVKAIEMKAAGIDWKAVLLKQWKATKIWLMNEVQRDPSLNLEEDRVSAFAARVGEAEPRFSVSSSVGSGCCAREID